MSIKDRGKKYAEILDFLRKEYVTRYGKEATGLADTMLKRQAAEKVEEMMKVVPFPETKITDWTKERPMEGPKADVKTFPKEKKLTPEPRTNIERLEKELEEMEKLGQPYKDTSVSDFLSDYFDMPQKAPPKRNITELNNVKLYGDETFEELQIIKDTGEHPRDKKANGGRIGYAEGMSAEEAVAGRLPPKYKFVEDADLKRSPEGIVMEGYQDNTTLEMLRDALRGAPKTPSVVEYDDGTLYYPELDEYYKEDGKQVEGPAFWAKPIPKLFEVPKHQERKYIDLANGGRIGFKFGTGKRSKTVKEIMDEVNKKLGTKTTGGEVKLTVDIPEPPKAELQRMFDEFNQRFKEKTTDTEITLPSGIKGIIDTTYEPKIKKFEGMSKIILSPEEATKLAKKEKLEGIESLLSGEKIALSRGQGKGLMVNHNGKIFIREKIKDRPNPIKEDEKAIIEEFDSMFDEEPIQMSMDDLIKYRSENPAGKGRFTRAEAIIARLENTIQGAKDNPDETSDYVLKNFPNMIEELKNKPELANNENVWKELGMTGLPENQRFKLYDDGTVDFETLKPTHQFKLREDIKRKLNAEGGLNYLMGL